MPGPPLHLGAVVQCPHGAPAQVLATGARVTFAGMPAALISDKILATGCPFTVPPGKPQPCLLCTWLIPSTRVTVNGAPLMVAPGPSLFQSADQIPAGPAIVATVQTRVTVI